MPYAKRKRPLARQRNLVRRKRNRVLQEQLNAYLAAQTEDRRRAVMQAIERTRGVRRYGLPVIFGALEIEERHKVPLSLALEIAQSKIKVPFTTQPVSTFLRRLNDNYVVPTKHGRVVVTPSFRLQSGEGKGFYLLNKFARMAFRIVPAREDLAKFRSHDSNVGGYPHVLVVEIGFVRVGGKNAILVTNAQATKQYYRWPWSLKKIFKGSYDKTLEIIRKAAGGIPVLIPSNATVLETLTKNLGHTAPEGVLDEFYDGFCRKRGRKPQTLEVENVYDRKKMTGDFWVPPQSNLKK